MARPAFGKVATNNLQVWMQEALRVPFERERKKQRMPTVAAARLACERKRVRFADKRKVRCYQHRHSEGFSVLFNNSRDKARWVVVRVLMPNVVYFCLLCEPSCNTNQ